MKKYEVRFTDYYVKLEKINANLVETVDGFGDGVYYKYFTSKKKLKNMP